MNKSRWEYSIKMYLHGIGGILNWNNVSQDRDGWRGLVEASVNFGYHKCGEFLDQLRNYWLVKEKSALYSYFVRVNRKLISAIRFWTFAQQPWGWERFIWRKLAEKKIL